MEERGRFLLEVSLQLGVVHLRKDNLFRRSSASSRWMCQCPQGRLAAYQECAAVRAALLLYPVCNLFAHCAELGVSDALVGVVAAHHLQPLRLSARINLRAPSVQHLLLREDAQLLEL